MCNSWNYNYSCEHGKNCFYAHSEIELAYGFFLLLYPSLTKECFFKFTNYHYDENNSVDKTCSPINKNNYQYDRKICRVDDHNINNYHRLNGEDDTTDSSKYENVELEKHPLNEDDRSMFIENNPSNSPLNVNNLPSQNNSYHIKLKQLEVKPNNFDKNVVPYEKNSELKNYSTSKEHPNKKKKCEFKKQRKIEREKKKVEINKKLERDKEDHRVLDEVIAELNLNNHEVISLIHTETPNTHNHCSDIYSKKLRVKNASSQKNPKQFSSLSLEQQAINLLDKYKHIPIAKNPINITIDLDTFQIDEIYNEIVDRQTNSNFQRFKLFDLQLGEKKKFFCVATITENKKDEYTKSLMDHLFLKTYINCNAKFTANQFSEQKNIEFISKYLQDNKYLTDIQYPIHSPKTHITLISSKYSDIERKLMPTWLLSLRNSSEEICELSFIWSFLTLNDPEKNDIYKNSKIQFFQIEYQIE